MRDWRDMRDAYAYLRPGTFDGLACLALPARRAFFHYSPSRAEACFNTVNSMCTVFAPSVIQICPS